jgi:SAM-dependent methyltransferase
MSPQMADHDATRQRVAELERECAELRRRLEVVYTSKSWTLTSPLRRGGAIVRGSLAAAKERIGGGDAPHAPAALRDRVAGTADLGWFKLSSRTAIEDIDEALRANGRALAEFEHVFDFGCGCGRLTVPLAARVGAGRITATDTDAEATAWLRRRLPGARVASAPVLPPLPFAADEFDLIIGWSIFTHLPEDFQDAWLEELARVLAPGGLMLQTVSGQLSFEIVGAAIDDPVRNALPGEGFIFYEGNYGADSPFEPYYQTSFHHHDYINEHWSKWFEIAEIRPGRARPSMDMVVLRSRA